MPTHIDYEPLTTPIVIENNAINFLNFANTAWAKWFGQIRAALNNQSTIADINVRDFGAKGDGQADDARAINAAIQQARTSGGGTVRLPAGRYRVASSINLTGFGGSTIGSLHLAGDGAYTTAIISDIIGAPVLDLTGSDMLRLSNFAVRCNHFVTEILLLARPVSGASSGDHLFDHVNLFGPTTHAVATSIGSEQNLFLHCGFFSQADGPAFTGCMTPTTPPGGNNTAAGWTPSSPFVAIGTGEGGNSSNVFVGCRFDNDNYDPMTRSLVYLWGMHATSFYGCFFASGAPYTIDIRGIPYPTPFAGYYKSSVTFDTCADENPVSALSSKGSILFSNPHFTTEPSVRGCHIRNCWFFVIYGDDNAWIDDLEFMGGHASASTPGGAPVPYSTKLSVWQLDNAVIMPSLHERQLEYEVRNRGSGLIFGAIPIGNIKVPAGTSFTALDPNTGTFWARAFASPA
jgi:hypothetical protein